MAWRSTAWLRGAERRGVPAWGWRAERRVPGAGNRVCARDGLEVSRLVKMGPWSLLSGQPLPVGSKLYGREKQLRNVVP